MRRFSLTLSGGTAARANGSSCGSGALPSPTEAPRPKAVLVGVQLSGVTDAEQRSSLKELERLCETLGFEVVGEVTQKRQGLGAATLLGKGKLGELAAWTGGTGVVPTGPPGKKKATEEEEGEDETERRPRHRERAPPPRLDHELSPQLRNLARATSAAESGRRLIIDIFPRRSSYRPRCRSRCAGDLCSTGCARRARRAPGGASGRGAVRGVLRELDRARSATASRAQA